MTQSEAIKQVVDRWCESLVDVLESMTGEKPEVEWESATGSLSEIIPRGEGCSDPETVWWEQPFQVSPEMVIWVAAPPRAWTHAGRRTLKAAGLDDVGTGEARNTWLEIVGQSLSGMAQSLGAVLGREVSCDPGVERQADPDVRQWALLTFKLGDAPPANLLAAFSPKFIAEVVSPRPDAGGRDTGSAQLEHPANMPARSRTMDLLLDVDLPVSISFGKAQMPLKDVLKLTTGSIVELNRGINEEVDVLVNQCLVARGEVVVIEGNYGVRIQEIVSRQDRLRSLR